MQFFFGKLVINDLDSTLEPSDAWLWLAGIADPQQAGWAATHYIINTKGIQSGTPVAVTGIAQTVGTQSVIVMSDIALSAGLEQHVERSVSTGLAKRASPKSRKKKSRTKA